MQSQRVCLVINPRDGQNVAQLPAMLAIFSAAGWQTDVVLKEYGGHAMELATDAASKGYGGDGTLNQVVNGLMNSKKKRKCPARRAAGQTDRVVESSFSRHHRSATPKQAGLLKAKGPHFMALRELFDQVTQGGEGYANLIAEHIVQLGGMAEGTAHAVARRSSLDEYWLSTANGQGHIDALSTTLAAYGKHARYASEQATDLKDTDTADIFTEIARGIDKWLWFVETSQQASN